MHYFFLSVCHQPRASNFEGYTSPEKADWGGGGGGLMGGLLTLIFFSFLKLTFKGISH